jgi:hypothetical protein
MGQGLGRVRCGGTDRLKRNVFAVNQAVGGSERSVGDTREASPQRLKHPFDFCNALSDCYQTLRRIDVTLRLATKMPFDFCGNKFFVHLIELPAQNFREVFSLGTFRGWRESCV